MLPLSTMHTKARSSERSSSGVIHLLNNRYGNSVATEKAGGPRESSRQRKQKPTNIFAKELRGREISVNAVAPGPTATDLFLNGKTPEQIAQMAKMAPLERLGRPEDISGVVSFLVGPDGAWVNGQTLRANGGIV